MTCEALDEQAIRLIKKPQSNTCTSHDNLFVDIEYSLSYCNVVLPALSNPMRMTVAFLDANPSACKREENHDRIDANMMKKKQRRIATIRVMKLMTTEEKVFFKKQLIDINTLLNINVIDLYFF